MTTSTQGADQRRLWLDESQLRYHLRQFDEPYRSTVHLTRFLSSLPLHGGEALDVGCGAGANMYHLSVAFPAFHWTGVDYAGDLLFPVGRAQFARAGLDVTLLQGDLFELGHVVAGRRYDLVLSVQTLSWLPNHVQALEQALAVTRGWLVITSLFSDGDVDSECLVYDHTIMPELPPYHINVYSLPRIRAFCEGRGCREFRSADFAIDVDLPAPETGGLGTYTRCLDDGCRIQFTGPVYLPWKFVAVRMGD